MPDLLIRDAGEADIPAVRTLLVETWHDTYDALIGADRVKEITDSWHSIDNLRAQLSLPDALFLVADENGTIVGHILAHARRPPALTIARLYVRPSLQRRGIGSRLIGVAVARHPACEVVRLEVEADNAKGLAFYRGQGFQAIGERMEEGIRHLVMEKSL